MIVEDFAGSEDSRKGRVKKRKDDTVLFEPGVTYVNRDRPSGRDSKITKHVKTVTGGLQQLLSAITDTAREATSSFSVTPDYVSAASEATSLDTLPSIIRDTEFDDNYLAHTNEGTLVPAYVASQLGFNVPGRFFLEHFYSRLREEAGILPICPFQACGEYLDLSRLDAAESITEHNSFWDEFNQLVPRVNYEVLIPHSRLMVAILDGGHALDDGVSAEVSHYAAHYPESPVVGIRSDVRLAENPRANINPAVSYFMASSNTEKHLFEGDNAYENAIRAVERIAGDIRKGNR